MILYFANRRMEIIGNASTNMRRGLVIKEDMKAEEVETGVATFECKIGFNKETRSKLEEMAKAGNYLLRKHDGENEFYTIIDTEIDTKNSEVYVYAEDAGLDLLNEIAEAYEATEAHPVEWYINKWIIDSGFEIGINEIPASSTRKLSWEGESTVTERLASIATQFGGYEISFSFEIKGMEVSKKYVNIYAERGKNTEETLRLNRELDRIVVKQSVANLATAFRCTGGVSENEEDPITLKGYTYDDGDFYVASDGILRSRNAVEKWSRYVWNNEPNKLDGYSGHIIRSYSYETTNQATLCAHAITELKKICDTEINYEIDINTLPANIKIGDRINIVDDAGELYLSSRLLKLETSIVDNTQKATIGEHLIKDSGISMKVAELAAKFAEMAKSAARVKTIADAAKSAADQAQKTAGDALTGSNNAIAKANEATAAASNATQSAAAANSAANEVKAAVENVEKDVENLETTVSNAQTAAENAQTAADTAQTKADEAATAAAEALADAADAAAAVEVAQSTANTAVSKADTAQSTANTAKSEAATAQATANAAKLDAEKANEDIAALGENLETVSQTMQADYARKTELTETAASLQTQITQNAAEISSTASKVVELDETANNAAEQAAQAQTTADAAQVKANQATADAEAAQKAADDAASAAQAAQSEADTAKAAAATAQGVADKAKTDLEAAKTDLATVKGRVDATEEDIAAAEKAVETAQAAADTAKADAAEAAQKATAAQSTADTAKSNAAAAQTTANNAVAQATAAQQAADAAKDDAEAAQATADEAKANAQAAQSTANTAKTNAATAQSKADAAAQAAQAAQTAADNADAKAAAAASDLATAKSNLAAVTSRVDATEAEIAEAEEAVAAAQKAADDAAADAAAAQSTANTAKANAATAQTAANNAKTAADNAQKAADDAQDAADAAQAAVDSLAVRVTTAETKITQNSEEIALRATKSEVATTLGGYYTKTQTDAAIKVEADKISSQASKIDGLTSRMSTVEQTADGLTVELENLSVGGRNLIAGTSETEIALGGYPASSYTEGRTGKTINIPFKDEYVLSFEAKSTVNGDKIRCHFYSPNTTTKVETSTGYTSTSSDGLAQLTLTTTWKKYWVKYTQNGANTTTVKNWIVGRRMAGEGTGNISIRSIKLEEGNRATSWTPATEDVAGSISTAQTTANSAASAASAAQSTANTANSTANTAKNNAATAQSTANTARTEAANAAKTATNYLNFSSSGLVIGDMTASTLGRNILIDSDSVDIRNGSTVLASYQANKIELAKNSRTATIDLCNGVGQISNYDSGSYNRLTFTSSDELRFKSHCLTIDVTGTHSSKEVQSLKLEAYNTKPWESENIDSINGHLYIEANEYVNGLQLGNSAITMSGEYINLMSNYNDSVSIDINGYLGQISIDANGGINLTSNNSVVVAEPRIYANGGLRLKNGGQITGLTNANAEITMLQMNANNYTMLGYGSYSNSIGATYVDGNVVNIRSKGALNLTLGGNLEISAAVPVIDFHFGNSTASYTSRIVEEGSGTLGMFAPNGALLRAANTDGVGMFASTNSSYTGFFRPLTAGTCCLGTANNKWYAVYAANGTIQTSDRREKENIAPIGTLQLMPSDDGGPDVVVDLHSELFDRLQPVQYNFIKGNGKICFGLIAQDVIESMHEIGMNEDEFELVQHDFWPDEEAGETKDTYGLSYTNLFALLIHEVQKLKKEIKTLKAS